MNVIWVVSDTLRRDCVGAYGNKKIYTPFLDAFAERSVRFDRHYISGFPTMPTRADHLTGRFTMSFMLWAPLPKTVTTLPEILLAKGYHTAAVVDTPFYSRDDMNYSRGFISFYETVGQDAKFRKESPDVIADRRHETDYYAPQTFTKAMHWLEKHYKENFFLYIDTWDPHEPWDPPAYYAERYWPGYDGEVIEPTYSKWPDEPGYPEEKVKKAFATYCGEVTMVDTWFGHLLTKLDNLGIQEETAVIFTSDHGFYFGEHGGMFGKALIGRDPETGEKREGTWGFSPLYEEIVAIPLLVYVPGVKPGAYSGLTSAVDLMPTVMELMEEEIPAYVEGKSLVPMMKDFSTKGRDYIISGKPFQNTGNITRMVDDQPRAQSLDTLSMVTTDEWVLIYSADRGKSELYNLKNDPGQQHNVIADNMDKARELHQMLVSFLKETNVEPHILERRQELRM